MEQKNTQISFIKSTDFSTIETINQHKSQVCALLLLKDGRLASSSEDTTINIYNLSSLKLEITIITGHKRGVFYLFQLNDGRIFSCSGDRTIKIWKVTAKIYQCLKTIRAHCDPVKKIISLPFERVASCSWDKTIKIWSTKYPYKCLHTIKGHIDIVYSIILLSDNMTLVSGSMDKTLRCWDIMKYKSKGTINGPCCCSKNSLIEINNNRVVIGQKNLVIIANVVSYQIETMIRDNSLGKVNCFLLLNREELLCGCDGILYKFNIKESKCVMKKRKNEQSSSINSIILLNENTIALSYYNDLFSVLFFPLNLKE